jgi:hypothetical protein
MTRISAPVPEVAGRQHSGNNVVDFSGDIGKNCGSAVTGRKDVDHTKNLAIIN